MSQPPTEPSTTEDGPSGKKQPRRENPTGEATPPYKIVNDPIHGSMEFHPVIVAIMDTPEFQRLRDIKQLGGVYHVYPGASHNRFEHSLGVCHLAGQLLDELMKKHPEENITPKDKLMVQIAGLCHDMGHGPFSHTFDMLFMPLATGKAFEHENVSLLMFDHMIKKNKHVKDSLEKHKLGDKEQAVIKALIHTKEKKEPGNPGKEKKEPRDPHGVLKGREFLFEVVANKRNGVDVDKWDYFKRDAFYLGLPIAFDHNRMMKFCRVIDVDEEKQICSRDKEAFNLYSMFITRQNLHRKAYQHKTAKAVETMIVYGLLAAEKIIKIAGTNDTEKTITECVDDMEAFTKLTDSVFYQILASKDPKLKSAQAWLGAVQKRKIYKLVAETGPITNPDLLKPTKEEVEEGIVSNLSEEDQKALEEELLFSNTEDPRFPKFRFIVQIVKLDFGKKEKNPIDDIRFYSKDKEDEAVPVKATEISTFLPKDNMREMYIRVLLRPTDNKETDERCHKLLQDRFKQLFDKTVKESQPKAEEENRKDTPPSPSQPGKIKMYNWTYAGYDKK